MVTTRILYDGWPLIYAPLGAAAWHLRTLLSIQIDGVEAVLALPTEQQAAAPGLQTVFQHTHNHGEWEQHLLPRLAQEVGAAAIHTTTEAASLFGKSPTFVSPAGLGDEDRGRVNAALGRGGLARAQILWPSDLPAPKLPGTVRRLPPVVHAEFHVDGAAVGGLSHARLLTVPGSLPEEFILVHGLADTRGALRLLESWTWAAASIGELYPLVLVGLEAPIVEFVQAQLPKFHVEDSVRLLSELQAQDLAAIYKACTALVHLGAPAAWGNPLRAALACGKALVAHQEPLTEAIVGTAAYLVSADDLRTFGAAMITVVVDEKAREKLEDAAQQKAAHWMAAEFESELGKAYTEI